MTQRQGNYDAAFDAAYSPEFLALVIRVMDEYVRNHGRSPTPVELKALLMKPS